MKYTVKLNQKIYEVEIERAGSQTASMGSAPAMQSGAAFNQASASPTAAMPVMQVAPSNTPTSGSADIRVECPMPGKVLSIAVSVGQQVRAGECLMVVEAMKMENEIVAPQGGAVKQLLVSQGTMVDTGDILAVLI